MPPGVGVARPPPKARRSRCRDGCRSCPSSATMTASGTAGDICDNGTQVRSTRARVSQRHIIGTETGSIDAIKRRDRDRAAGEQASIAIAARRSVRASHPVDRRFVLPASEFPSFVIQFSATISRACNLCQALNVRHAVAYRFRRATAPASRCRQARVASLQSIDRRSRRRPRDPPRDEIFRTTSRSSKRPCADRREHASPDVPDARCRHGRVTARGPHRGKSLQQAVVGCNLDLCHQGHTRRQKLCSVWPTSNAAAGSSDRDRHLVRHAGQPRQPVVVGDAVIDHAQEWRRHRDLDGR